MKYGPVALVWPPHPYGSDLILLWLLKYCSAVTSNTFEVFNTLVFFMYCIFDARTSLRIYVMFQFSLGSLQSRPLPSLDINTQ